MKLIEYIQKHRCQQGRSWSSPQQKRALAILPAKGSEIAEHLGKTRGAIRAMMWRLQKRGLVVKSDWTTHHEGTWRLID